MSRTIVVASKVKILAYPSNNTVYLVNSFPSLGKCAVTLRSSSLVLMSATRLQLSPRTVEAAPRPSGAAKPISGCWSTSGMPFTFKLISVTVIVGGSVLHWHYVLHRHWGCVTHGWRWRDELHDCSWCRNHCMRWRGATDCWRLSDVFHLWSWCGMHCRRWRNEIEKKGKKGKKEKMMTKREKQ